VIFEFVISDASPVTTELQPSRVRRAGPLKVTLHVNFRSAELESSGFCGDKIHTLA